MSNQSISSIVDLNTVRWTPSVNDSPADSGIYLTRNDKDQAWFKYYEARLGKWTMSCAEVNANMPGRTATLADAEVDSHVRAWAQLKRA